MSSSSLSSLERTDALSLDFLEADPAPTFVVKVGNGAGAVAFELLFCNAAFRNERGLRGGVLADERAAMLFRAWAQAGDYCKSRWEFGGCVWSARVAGVDGDWKVVRAVEVGLGEQPFRDQNGRNTDVPIGTGRRLIKRQSTGCLLEKVSQSLAVPLQSLPRVNWGSIQRMMERSDVGVFEYDPSGKLIHANEAWYSLSSHPKDLSAHTDFSFMDLAYPDDQALVMSAWNTLLQGHPVTFEMRWKPRPGSSDRAPRILSSCVPMFDENRKLIGIAGTTIGLDAQKKCQGVVQERIEALEQFRLSELKFARFAQLAPIAIYIFKPDRGMQYVNDQFFELTGQPRVAFDQLDWSDFVAEEDIEQVQTGWLAVMEGKKPDHTQFRLKKTWINQEGVCSNLWVQGSSSPELDQDGNVVSIMGTLFDISQFKWAESVQRRRVEEALEAKRQQENFIDMTSHELRNPLSAVVQCADAVIGTLQELTPNQIASMQSEIEKVNVEIAMCIDSLQTIVSCSLHQKRVIDDVLTLSKLDSDLLLITPMRVQPAVVVSEAMKMFDVECSQMQISLEFREDESLKGFEWVMLDPSRLLQVLINLLTNAIKFTKDHPVRNVTVTLGGAWTRPSVEWQAMSFAQNGNPQSDICDKPEWGSGRKGFIWLKVVDTGCGMIVDEQKELFSRFTQASPRTHVKYGGSGLGLFISQSLASLQGGAIGVTSEADSGSTFAFYVGTRIAQAPSGADAGKFILPTPHLAASTEDAFNVAGLNILLVEDNLVNQKVLSTQLQKAGCNVSIAGNGAEALEWLKDSVYWRGVEEENAVIMNGNGGCHITLPPSPPEEVPSTRETSAKHALDIVLMDIEMPIMGGLTCARLIRDFEAQGLLSAPDPPPRQRTPQLSSASVSPISSFYQLNIGVEHAPLGTLTPSRLAKRRRLPILAVSANARSEQIEQALAAGMDDAISKPFRILDLWPKMSRLVPRCEALLS